MASPDRDRSRSRSPVRKPKLKASGFKWKDKKRDEDKAEPDTGLLKRGYRDRSPRRDSDRYRERSPLRSSAPNPTANPSESTSNPISESTSKPALESNTATTKATDSKPPKSKKEKEKKPPKPVSNEPMIIVYVNDRLGTKAAIPCLASDSVKMFKAVVAAHIGRQPHEIMLKRQGERPFKDKLTLEDYGVSSGVQLDLELDTGD